MSKIKGIPDGWELVRFDHVNHGEFYLDGNGVIIHHPSPRPTQAKRLVIRKIEKPKRYRPFANAAEFEPFSDMWLNRVDNNGNELPGRCKINGYDDEGFWNHGVHLTFAWAFEVGHKFANGDQRTPFGIEVTE